MRNNDEKRKQYLVILIIFTISTLLSLFIYGFATYLNIDKFELKGILIVLSGNFLIDIVLYLCISSIILIPSLIIFKIIMHVLKKPLNKDQLINFIAITYIFLTIISILNALFGNFKYIRISVGCAPLAFLFSLIALNQNIKRNRLKFILYLGIVLPTLITWLVPISLTINNISWSHFDD